MTLFPDRHPTQRARRHRILKPFLLALAPLLISACAGAAFSTPTSWPGLSSDGESVYLAFGEAVYALDPASGALRWRYPLQPERGLTFFAPPAWTDSGLVIAGSFSNTLVALRAEDGSVAWGPISLQEDAGSSGRVVGAPVVAGELVLVPSGDGRLYARSLRDGSKVWTFPAESLEPLAEAIWASPLVADDRVYLSSLDHRVYAVDLERGQPIWPDGADLSGAIADTPTLAGDLLLTGTFANRLVALEASTGRERWSFAANNWVWGSPAVGEGVAYFGDLSGGLYAVSLQDGTQRWQLQADGLIAASPVLQEETLYVVTEVGTILARQAESSNPLWQTTIEGQLLTEPLLLDDTLLVATNGGPALLTAYDTDSGAVRWAFSLEP